GVGDPLDPYAYAHAPAALPTGDWSLATTPEPAPLEALQLGWGLGTYRFTRYKPGGKAPAQLALDAPDAEVVDVLAACVRVRDLVNTPTQDMGPDELEAATRAIAEAHGASFESIVGDELLAQNFPAIHAVGRASHRAPRLLKLQWGFACAASAAHPHLTLLVPAVENAIGPDAFRPGEVVATRKGVSVEIDNTDAEGRVVLCDALTLAGELSPDLILDFATLTGAARVALGPDLPALFAN